MKKIGMVVAVEIKSVMNRFADRLKEEKVRGFEVYSVEYEDKILYITKSGAGEIRAAAATQMLISEFDVEMIVNYGVVGALTDKLAVAHTCIVEKAVHYDYDTSAIDFCEVGRYLEYDSVYLPTTAEYIDIAGKYAPSIPKVICASGDKFITDVDRKNELNRVYDASICDMESAAVVLVCDMNSIPNLLIKTVSDSITGGADEYLNRVDEAADICLDLVDKIVSDL